MLRHYEHLIKHITCTDDVANFSDHLPLYFSLALDQPLALSSKHTQITSGHPLDTFPIVELIGTGYPLIIEQPTVNSFVTICQLFLMRSFPAVTPSVNLISLHMTHCLQLLLCILTAADLCLPKAKTKKSVVPGWNTHVRSLRQAAAFWHEVWTEFSHPASGVLFQIKKKTKKRYKYEVYRLRRQLEHIIRERLDIALSQSRHRGFCKEVHKITLSSKGRGSSAPIVDGCSSVAGISSAFSAKLCDLLNSDTSLDSRSHHIENTLSCDELLLTSVSADTVS